MAKRKEFGEDKKNIIAGLLEEYEIQSAEDIQGMLKDLLVCRFYIITYCKYISRRAHCQYCRRKYGYNFLFHIKRPPVRYFYLL